MLEVNLVIIIGQCAALHVFSGPALEDRLHHGKDGVPGSGGGDPNGGGDPRSARGGILLGFRCLFSVNLDDLPSLLPELALN